MPSPRPLPLLLPLLACGDINKDDTSDTTGAALWADYAIAPPNEDIVQKLGSPYQMPYTTCVPGDEAPSGAVLDEAGQLCTYDHFNASVPEGMRYTDLHTCDAAFSQGPPWFAAPQRVYESPAALLDDPAYVAELQWVAGQVEASGCGCCHAAATGSGHTSGFDMSAPGVWTDTMTNSQLAMAGGRFPEHRLFGYFDPAENQGFDRSQPLFPTTDPARLNAFFEAELARRGGTQADIDEAQAQFNALFGALFEPVSPCVDPYEGIVEGRLTWNGDAVRQIYVLEEGADTPAFTPNLDLPAGTLWAVYVNNDANPIPTGSLALGEVPDGAVQRIPADGSLPALVDGQTYRLLATEDIMQGRVLNCTFTHRAGSAR